MLDATEGNLRGAAGPPAAARCPVLSCPRRSHDEAGIERAGRNGLFDLLHAFGLAIRAEPDVNAGGCNGREVNGADVPFQDEAVARQLPSVGGEFLPLMVL